MIIAFDSRLPREWYAPLDRHTMLPIPEDEQTNFQGKDYPWLAAEVLMTTFYQKITRELISSMPNLRLVTQFGVGYDNIDVATCRERDILVANTPHPVIEPTAELCFGLMLSLVRRVPELDRSIRNHTLTFGLMQNLGHSLSGKTLGIIGLGNIGKALARRAVASNMCVLYHNRHRLTKEQESQYQVRYVSMEELLRESDVVSLNLPMSAEVRHLIGERELRMMKSTAYLVNTARGAHVDEPMLARALKEGWIAGAALDVFEREPEICEELKSLDNCVLVPHIGTATWECRREMADAMVANILAFEENHPEKMTLV